MLELAAMLLCCGLGRCRRLGTSRLNAPLMDELNRCGRCLGGLRVRHLLDDHLQRSRGFGGDSPSGEFVLERMLPNHELLELLLHGLGFVSESGLTQFIGLFLRQFNASLEFHID